MSEYSSSANLVTQWSSVLDIADNILQCFSWTKNGKRIIYWAMHPLGRATSLAQNCCKLRKKRRYLSSVHKFFFRLALYNSHFHFLLGNVLNCHCQQLLVAIFMLLLFSLACRQQASSWLEKDTFTTTSNFSYVYGKKIKS